MYVDVLHGSKKLINNDVFDSKLLELIRQCCVHRYQILHTAGLGTNFLLLVNEPNGFSIELV